jgi:hypothetical protein
LFLERLNIGALFEQETGDASDDTRSIAPNDDQRGELLHSFLVDRLAVQFFL